jgi:hypothetical protein
MARKAPKTSVDEFPCVGWIAAKLTLLIICYNFSDETHYPNGPAQPIDGIE